MPRGCCRGAMHANSEDPDPRNEEQLERAVGTGSPGGPGRCIPLMASARSCYTRNYTQGESSAESARQPTFLGDVDEATMGRMVGAGSCSGRLCLGPGASSRTGRGASQRRRKSLGQTSASGLTAWMLGRTAATQVETGVRGAGSPASWRQSLGDILCVFSSACCFWSSVRQAARLRRHLRRLRAGLRWSRR